jgi:hypothetical protein
MSAPRPPAWALGVMAAGALWSAPAGACSCALPEPWFLGRVQRGEVVVLAEVAELSGAAAGAPTLMDLEVKEVLKGGDGARGRVRVLGGGRADFRSPLTPFKPGTRWLFVLTSLQQAEEWVRSGAQYELVGCGGIWWARVEGETVRGLLTARDVRTRKESELQLAEVRRQAAERSPRPE